MEKKTLHLVFPGGLSKVESKLDQKSLEGLMTSFVSHQLELQVPHLHSNSVLNLNNSYASLGIDSAFSDKADFSGINGAKNLRISSFIQANTFQFDGSNRRKRDVVQARVRKVDPVFSLLSRQNRQNEIYQLSFERQFLYMVRHNPTGLLVYIGRYHHPHDHHHHDHEQ